MFERLVGNNRLKELLRHEISSNSFAHGYIIEGERGIGKHTLAYDITAALAGFDEAELKRVKDGRCPDVRVVGVPDGRKGIGVELIRDLRYQASITPNELDFKMTIIENADLMTVQAQNAFLKLLEEPPRNVYFLMLCENSSVLLPTVRSRASVLKMQRCSIAELQNHLITRSKGAASLRAKKPQTFETVIRAADGRIGIALELCGSRQVEKAHNVLSTDKNAVQKATELVGCIVERRSAPLILCVSKLGSDRSELCNVFSSVAAAHRDLILCKAHMLSKAVIDSETEDDLQLSSEKLCFFENSTAACENAQRMSMVELVRSADAVLAASERMLWNGNARQILTELALKLRQIVC